MKNRESNIVLEELIKTVKYLVKETMKKEPYIRIADGVIQERTFDSYTVLIDNNEYYDISPLNENDNYEEGDLVYIIIQNINYGDKTILGHRVGGRRSTKIDRDNMPNYPVQIVREGNDPRGKAVRFNYGFEGSPVEKSWSQVLHRNSKNQVFMITDHFFDGTVEYNYLLRNEADRVEYYGRNQNFNS